jgi:hypothetical protein
LKSPRSWFDWIIKGNPPVIDSYSGFFGLKSQFYPFHPGWKSELIAPFAIIAAMPEKKRKTGDRPVFESIRKPTAPPSRKFGEGKPEEKARPSGRKSKHKKRNEYTE